MALVGGGNSAGPAAVFLSQHASKVHVFVRGQGLAGGRWIRVNLACPSDLYRTSVSVRRSNRRESPAQIDLRLDIAEDTRELPKILRLTKNCIMLGYNAIQDAQQEEDHPMPFFHGVRSIVLDNTQRMQRSPASAVLRGPFASRDDAQAHQRSIVASDMTASPVITADDAPGSTARIEELTPGGQ